MRANESPRGSIPPTAVSQSQSPCIAASYVAGDKEDASAENLPPAIASEIKSIDATCARSKPAGRSSAGDLTAFELAMKRLLKSSAGDPAVEEAIRVRLERLEQLEQAAKSAATIQTILAQSHRRDREVIALKRQLAIIPSGPQPLAHLSRPSDCCSPPPK